jgi:hypothetical protein
MIMNAEQEIFWQPCSDRSPRDLRPPGEARGQFYCAPPREQLAELAAKEHGFRNVLIIY